MENSARYEQGMLVGGLPAARRGSRPPRRPRGTSRRRTHIPETERQLARRHIAEMREILAALHPHEERQAS